MAFCLWASPNCRPISSMSVPGQGSMSASTASTSGSARQASKPRRQSWGEAPAGSSMAGMPSLEEAVRLVQAAAPKRRRGYLPGAGRVCDDLEAGTRYLPPAKQKTAYVKGILHGLGS